MRALTFKCLLAKWYNKLEKEGFVDIERTAALPNIDYRNATVRDREAIQTYFSAARSYLFRARFDISLEKDIWKCHSEGLSLSQIKDVLGVTRSYAHSVIVRHREQAGLKRRT